MSEDRIEAMTDDNLLTFTKLDKRGYESKIQALETCREDMMSAVNVMGRRITPL